MTTTSFSAQVLQRYEIIRPHLEDGVPLTQLADLHGCSERTLRRWVAQFHKDGLAGLERKVRSDRGQRRKIAAELVDMIRACILQKPPLPIAVIHRRMVAYAQAQQLQVPSYAVVHDIVRAIDPALVTLAQKGSRVYRQQYDLIYRREASAPNELWQADHTLLDIVLLNEKQEPQRPWLTTILDDYSRALCGYYLSFEAPNAVNTALALRQGIWRKAHTRWPICGIPQILYVDNGSDFTSEHLEQACIHLKIRLVHSLPGKPRGRGKIERLFLTLNQRLLIELPGYVQAGQSTSPPSLNLTTFTTHFEAFIHDTYHPYPHSATGQLPLVRWQNHGFLPNLPETREDLDLLLLCTSKTRKVQRDGIRFQALRYLEPTLAAFIGEQVEIRYDPRDLAEIFVYHQGHFVCRALAQDIAGQTLSLRDIRQARDRRRAALRRELTPLQQQPEAASSSEEAPSAPQSHQPFRFYHHD
jgi:putative transposase